MKTFVVVEHKNLRWKRSSGTINGRRYSTLDPVDEEVQVGFVMAKNPTGALKVAQVQFPGRKLAVWERPS